MTIAIVVRFSRIRRQDETNMFYGDSAEVLRRNKVMSVPIPTYKSERWMSRTNLDKTIKPNQIE